MVVIREPKSLRKRRRLSPPTSSSRPIHSLQNAAFNNNFFFKKKQKNLQEKKIANLRNGTVRRIGQVRRQRARVHGPSDSLSTSDRFLLPHPPLVGALSDARARRRNLIHLPKRRRQLPRRHRRRRRLLRLVLVLMLGSEATRFGRVQGTAQCRSRRSRRAHEPPCRHGRSGSASLANEYRSLEPVVLEYRGRRRRRRRAASLSDLSRYQIHTTSSVLSWHYHFLSLRNF